MKNLSMPQKRDYGWTLKETSSTYFGIHKRENGQFCVILNHSLLRGVTAEMIYWWFRNFQNIKVKLNGIKGFENKLVPAYLLWHPSDHVNALLYQKNALHKQAETGDTIHIQETMQYETYQWKYPVNKKLSIFYCQPDGWAMGKKIPFFGEAMVLRIHFKDVVEHGKVIGVHYHYEIVIGVTGNNFLAKTLNNLLTKELSTEFFEAWHLHNTIEVGTFENFLPSLYAQRESPNFNYTQSMNTAPPIQNNQSGYSEQLFNERLEGYKTSNNPFNYQKYTATSFL